MDSAPAVLGPVAEGQRIAAMDALRGVALLGIFAVNIQFFAMPLVDYVIEPVPAGRGPAEVVCWAIVKAFFEFKFISIFSLLFGAGLIVQMRRAEAAGRELRPLYLRRLVVLGVIGLLHGIFLWYGDILFMYSGVALLAFLLRWLAPRVQMLVAAAGIGLSVGIAGCAATLGALRGGSWPESPDVQAAAAEPGDEGARSEGERAVSQDEAPAATEPEAPPQSPETGAPPVPADPWERFREALRQAAAGNRMEDWRRVELIAYAQGPWAAALAVRAVSFAGILVLSAAGGLLFRVAGMFLLGGALAQLDFFDRSRRRWHVALAGAALPLGAAAELAAVRLYLSADGLGPAFALAEWLHEAGSVLLCMGYVGAVVLVGQSRAGRMASKPFEAVGRTALTNYLLQTVVATFVTYWWGLGLFGAISRPAQLVLVVGVYVVQVVLSMAWLSLLTMGPIEWLWRAATYLRFPPMRRRA
jgi:uncharacterized protein